MAGYKETPRQKMIGMMYLVLTALLALNVSKEILDAFLVVNESITVTNENFERKINETYSDFKKQYELNPEKVKDEWAEALRARAWSQSMVKYMDSLKFEVISKTEGIPMDTARIIELINVKKKDNFDTPTNFFVGGDTKVGVAFAMVDSMSNYRERMLKIVDERRRPIFDKRMGLKTDGEYKNAQGKAQNWINHNFYHTILAADVTIMNKIKAEIFNAEAEIINYLYSSINEADFKFSGLEANVLPESNYIFKGDEYKAKISIGAVDETQNPIVYLIQNADTMTKDQINNSNVERYEGSFGVVELTLPASSEGVKKYAGIIEMLDPNGDPQYLPFNKEYMVAQPSATVSPTKMNVFYRGVDNPVSISASGIADSQLKPEITAGSVIRTDTGWVVNKFPADAYETIITIRSTEGKVMGSQKFRVKSLPDPVARILNADDGKVKLKTMLANPFLLCTLPEWVDFKYDFKVTSFTMFIPQGGGYFVTESSESQMFSEKMKSQIENLKKNDVVVFRDIKVRGPEGPRKIESINITIQ